MTSAALRFLAASMIAASATQAQAQAPVGGVRVNYASLNSALEPENVFGYLYLPPNTPAGKKHPAVVVVHGSGGVRDAREGDYGRALSDSGIAVLAVDAFNPRGVQSTFADNSTVATSQMVRDAYAALAFLSKHPAIEPQRIGLMGMSKGGAVALQAADPREQADARKKLGGGGFVAHIPIYPACMAQYRNPRMTAPMLVLIGADDDYTGVKPCAEYLERIRAGGGKAELKVYPGAVHGFDGDTSSRRHFFVPTAENYLDCVYYREDDGRVVTRAGTSLVLSNLRATIDVLKRECMRLGATVGGDANAKVQALADIKSFLNIHLMH